MFEQPIKEAAARLNLSTASLSAVVTGLLSLMSNERSGGPEGFVDRFRRAGLGDVITSWFGGKEGRTITPSHVESALGTDALDKLAVSSGLARATVSAAAAFLLPRLIGRLTPNGVYSPRAPCCWPKFRITSIDRLRRRSNIGSNIGSSVRTSDRTGAGCRGPQPQSWRSPRCFGCEHLLRRWTRNSR